MSRLKHLSYCDIRADTALSDVENFILDQITEQEMNAPDKRLLLNNVKLFYELIKAKKKLLKHIQQRSDTVHSSNSSVADGGTPEDDKSVDDSSSSSNESGSSVNNDVEIVLVARGSISGCWETGSSVVDHPGINDVVLYQPWNCALDANAAFAICSGSLKPSGRNFKHCIHYSRDGRPKRCCQQQGLNYLTRAKQAKIPQIFVQACLMDRKNLGEVSCQLGSHDKFDNTENQLQRFILPYAVRVSEGPHFGRVPLSIVCQAIGAVCSMFNLTATIHMVCDLTSDKLDQVKHVKQYCHVISDVPDQQPTMTCTIQGTDLSAFTNAIRPFLCVPH
jgi:hypothetical protein